MPPIPFKRHRFPPDMIRHAVWLYFRFSLSLRDVEEMLAQRGIEAAKGIGGRRYIARLSCGREFAQARHGRDSDGHDHARQPERGGDGGI